LEIKYYSKKINFANRLSRQSNYKKEANNKIYLSILQNKLRNIIIATVDLTVVFIQKIVKNQKLYSDSVFESFRAEKINKNKLEKFLDI